jgi:acetyl-CoA synthetase
MHEGQKMTPARKRLYSREDLKPLYAPRRIAVVGATPRAGAFGQRTFQNLEAFSGEIDLVNARYDAIDGKACHPSLQALPVAPDLAVITTPGASVEEVLEDCIAAGVPAAMVYASGFAETGSPEDVERQARLARRAQEGGVRLLGPNCVGLLNYQLGARVSFAGVPDVPAVPAGMPAIGLVSQSGALGFALAQAAERGVRFSHVLSCGNSADVDVADWINVLAEDPDTTVIACSFEGLADPDRFRRAAEAAWRADKPLIVHKLATGSEGAAAAMSHTGSLAGAQAHWQALFEAAGVIAVEDFEQLVETAAFFAKAPAALAPGVALLAGSGGAAILGADCAEAVGVPLPQPEAQGLEALRAVLPPFVAPRNPCDVTAQVINDREALLACADTFMSDPRIGALIYAYTYAYPTATARMPFLSELSLRHGKPVVFVWVTQLLEGPGVREAEQDPRLVIFRSMRSAFEAIRAWSRSSERRARGPAPAVSVSGLRIDDLSGNGALSETESYAILAVAGVEGPHRGRATSAAEATEIATSIGGRLAFKIDSPDILHKTEAGGVALNVPAEHAAEQYEAIMAACARAAPAARLLGVNIQEMVPQGVEVLVGLRKVAGFGTMLTVGMGGVLTEILRDTVTVLAPVGPWQAEAVLRRLRGAALFDGYRGAAPVNMAALAEAVSALSRLADANAGRLAEMEINPLVALPDRVVAVDALVVLEGEEAR